MTALVERIASYDAPGGHNSPFDDAVLLNRRVGIIGAGWMEPAITVRKEYFQRSMIKGQRFLVYLDDF